MMSAAIALIPEIAPYCLLAYAEKSHLQYGFFTIQHEVSPQQGDSLGPILFYLPLQSILVKLSTPLVFGYLDDIYLGACGRRRLYDPEQECATLGRPLNILKCEFIIKNSQLF